MLASLIPVIAEFKAFALKGGTAINLFYRDLPRISVDLDLVYLPVSDRSSSLRAISRTLDQIISSIQDLGAQIQLQYTAGGTRILAHSARAQVKIETSPVMRGTVYPPDFIRASDAAIEQLGYLEMNVVAFEDLYGGKLHAALDRQHPRDLFDIMLLYENEGLTDDLFRVFLAYAAGSGRPLHELAQTQRNSHQSAV